eukprot:9479271-Pyramimonas_sp.AAC.1
MSQAGRSDVSQAKRMHGSINAARMPQVKRMSVQRAIRERVCKRVCVRPQYVFVYGHFGSSVMEPPSKIARRTAKLSELGRASHVTASALSSILKDSSSQDLPEAFSTFSIQKARQQIAFQATDFGPIIQDIPTFDADGKDIGLVIIHPFAFLQAACKESCEFKSVLVNV